MPNAQTKTPSRSVSNRDSYDKLGDQGGFFDLVVKPMLQQGHEGELCGWLKESSLIRSFISCANSDCNDRNMTWSPARIIDKYNWVCSECNSKKSIRENSFFMRIKCDLKLCLQIILAWCQRAQVETVVDCLGIKEHIVKKVYENCALVANSYVEQHTNEWSLGGSGMVVIVDEFPSGYMTQNTLDVTVNKKRNNNSQTILCIAEANKNCVPPNMWFHIISSHAEMKSEKNHALKQNAAEEEALNQIMQHVLPGSFIVTNNRARCCNYEAVQQLKQYHVFSVENLHKYDAPGGTELLQTLETIWQTGTIVCEDVQDATQAMSKQILSTYLWRQKFSCNNTAIQWMLNHIAEYYKFS